MPQENAKAAFDLVSAAMAPMEREMLEEYLAVLDAVTATGRRSDNRAKLAFEVYSQYLSWYPADVIKAALNEFIKTSKWFPTLFEVIDEANKLVAFRLCLVDQLNKKILYGEDNV